MCGVNFSRMLVLGGLAIAIVCSLFLFPLPVLAGPGAYTGQAMPYDPPSPDVNEPASIEQDLQPVAYIPMLMNCYNVPAGIYGYVTKAGVPASKISVKLMMRNISVDSEIASSETNSCGYFSFPNIQGVGSGSGKGYFIRFRNDGSIPGSLIQWDTHVLTPYVTNQTINIENFDIGDVFLGDPNGGDPLPLPVTFHWTKRSHSPTDSYIYYILEYIANEPDPYHPKYNTPPLGYVDNVEINSGVLPSDMKSNTTYYWYVSIIGPYVELESNNSKGYISQMRPVQFSNLPH